MKFFVSLAIIVVLTVISSANVKQIKLDNGCKIYLEANEDGALTTLECSAPDGERIFTREKEYDPSGNNIKLSVFYKRNGRESSRLVAFEYDKNSNQTAIIREPGSENKRTTYLSYNVLGSLIEKKHPNDVSVYYDYIDDRTLERVYSSDATVDYYFTYYNNKIEIYDSVNDLSTFFVYDNKGNLKQEIFPNDFVISYEYFDDGKLSHINIPKHGSIGYLYKENEKIEKVSRYSEGGCLEYIHQYSYIDNFCVHEDMIYDLGRLTYSDHSNSARVQINSPYHIEECMYDSLGNIIEQKSTRVAKQFYYDHLFQLVHNRAYDSLNNPTDAIVNDLDELIALDSTECEYDLNGNLVLKKTNSEEISYTYDALNRLIMSKRGNNETHYVYDYFNRRLSKITHDGDEEKKEYYLYSFMNEIASFDADGAITELRIPGQSFNKDIVKAVAIEADENVYAPIYNTQLNISKLIDVSTKTVYDYSLLSPFGKNLSKLSQKKTSWIFSSKRYDSETNAIFFGSRYYDLDLERWTTLDPQYYNSSINLYCYVGNNPLRLIDPDGEFIIALPILGGAAVLGKAFIGGVIAATAAYYGDKAAKKINGKLEQKKWEEFQRQQAYERERNGTANISKQKSSQSKEFKKPKPKISGKDGAKNTPSWAKGNKPYTHESGRDFAKRLLDEKYGPNNYKKGANTEHNKIRKWGDRSWE